MKFFLGGVVIGIVSVQFADRHARMQIHTGKEHMKERGGAAEPLCLYCSSYKSVCTRRSHVRTCAG